MSAHETVAVVVVTYNRAGLLLRMLGGLAASERRPDAVIVVDNASTDGTAALLAARPSWKVVLDSFAAKGLIELPPEIDD